jgi:AraC-like DNA-binding protein
MASRLESVYHALQFIEAHLRDNISVADIADHCGYSLFHFIRLFNQFASQTPYDYLIRRRLSEALKELHETNYSIATLAYDYCFETPESFSRAFKRVFGLLPSSFRAGHPLSGCLPIPPRTRADLQYNLQGGFVQPPLANIESLTLAGMPVPLSGLERSEPTTQLSQLHQLLFPFEHLEDACVFTVSAFMENPFAPSSQFIGAAVDADRFPPPVTIQHIPSGAYLELTIHPRDYDLALRYLFYIWLPHARISLNGHYLVEEFLPDKVQGDPKTILIPVRTD